MRQKSEILRQKSEIVRQKSEIGTYLVNSCFKSLTADVAVLWLNCCTPAVPLDMVESRLSPLFPSFTLNYPFTHSDWINSPLLVKHWSY